MLEDLGEVYRFVYEFIRQGGKLLAYARWIEGEPVPLPTYAGTVSAPRDRRLPSGRVRYAQLLAQEEKAEEGSRPARRRRRTREEARCFRSHAVRVYELQRQALSSEVRHRVAPCRTLSL